MEISRKYILIYEYLDIEALDEGIHRPAVRQNRPERKYSVIRRSLIGQNQSKISRKAVVKQDNRQKSRENRTCLALEW